MSQPWERSIGALRRRAIAAGSFVTLGKIALPLAPVAALYLFATTRSPWARFLLPWFAGATALALVGAIVLGALWSRRSDVYLAKWIDMQSGLDDRLASAVAWS